MTALGWALVTVCGLPLLGALVYSLTWVVRETIAGDEGARAGLAMLGFLALCVGLSAGVALVAS